MRMHELKLTCAWAQSLVAGRLEDFQRQLHQMWFSLYSRSQVRDSTCGFEHGACPGTFLQHLRSTISASQDDGTVCSAANSEPQTGCWVQCLSGRWRRGAWWASTTGSNFTCASAPGRSTTSDTCCRGAGAHHYIPALVSYSAKHAAAMPCRILPGMQGAVFNG